jgi:signal transduction histidine kinase
MDLEPLAQSVLSEALRNVSKHADATVIDVAVFRDEDTFKLAIRNDGVSPAAHGTGIGLRLAAFEALQHGGMVEFGPTEDAGWRVRLVVPLQREAP